MNKIVRDVSLELASKRQPVKAIYISSYIPKKCGIATFTKDLTTAVNNLNPYALAEIIALTDDSAIDYPWEVKFRIGQHEAQDYAAAAQYINQSSADVVNLQHEFGLYGGMDGDYILLLLDSIKKPIVANFHSVLYEPSEHQAYLIKHIIERSEVVVGMTERTREMLQRIYGCPPRKSVVIHHGVPDFSFNNIEKHRQILKVGGEPMLLSAGLIGPGKGLEYVIEAMKVIVAKLPGAKLFIAGQTHPNLLREQGEKYRQGLERQVKQLGLTNNIVFVNRYLEPEEMNHYYQATDFFITAHLNPQQAMSGTLSQALGAGRVCISTMYHYAKEILDDGAGLLVDFRDSETIARHVLEVWANPERLLNLRRKAHQKGRTMTWPNIGQQYLNLFRIIKKQTGDAYQKTADVPVLAH